MAAFNFWWTEWNSSTWHTQRFSFSDHYLLPCGRRSRRLLEQSPAGGAPAATGEQAVSTSGASAPGPPDLCLRKVSRFFPELLKMPRCSALC